MLSDDVVREAAGSEVFSFHCRELFNLLHNVTCYFDKITTKTTNAFGSCSTSWWCTPDMGPLLRDMAVDGLVSYCWYLSLSACQGPPTATLNTGGMS